MPRLQTALTSEEQTPDLVEIGNTQSPTFTYAGAFADISDMYDELGGDDLLPGFVEAGSADDVFYAAPYYSGARAVFYRKDFFEAAGVQVPTTIGEFAEAARTLQEANPAGTPNFSGFWFPGQDWYNGTAWIYTHGGDLAVQQDGEWTGALSSPESLEGLAEVQDLFTNATSAPRDADSNEPWMPFNNGEAAMFSAPTWARWSIDLPQCNQGVDPEDQSEEATAARAEQQACNEERDRRLPAARRGGGAAGHGVRRRLQHRHPGHVAEPGPGAEPAADHVRRGVPDDAGRERADPRQQPVRRRPR